MIFLFCKKNHSYRHIFFIPEFSGLFRRFRATSLRAASGETNSDLIMLRSRTGIFMLQTYFGDETFLVK